MLLLTHSSFTPFLFISWVLAGHSNKGSLKAEEKKNNLFDSKEIKALSFLHNTLWVYHSHSSVVSIESEKVFLVWKI